MRTREQIADEAYRGRPSPEIPNFDAVIANQALLLEVLLDIRYQNEVICDTLRGISYVQQAGGQG